MFGLDEKIYYIDSKKEDASLQVSRRLSYLLRRCPRTSASSPVFVCIGSDRVTGDSLGPIIGSELKRAFHDSIPVYGTLEMPIHALNLSSILSAVRVHHKDDILIAIDASLGTPEHQGYITLGKGSLAPGAGVQKNLENIGDIFITGIVGPSGRYSHLTLQTTRLSAVMPVARQISTGILSLFASAAGNTYSSLTQPEIPSPSHKRLRHPVHTCAEALLPDRILRIRH